MPAWGARRRSSGAVLVMEFSKSEEFSGFYNKIAFLKRKFYLHFERL
jgi:hypothetical protein